MKIKQLSDLRLSDIKEIPSKKWDKKKDYTNLLITRTGKKHDSGYALIYLIGVNYSEGMCELEIAGACDDVSWNMKLSERHRFCGLRTDMLFPSGVARLWGENLKFEVGASLSSTEVTVKDRKK